MEALQEEGAGPQTGAEREAAGAAQTGSDEPLPTLVHAPAPSLVWLGIPVALAVLILGLGLGYLFARQEAVALASPHAGPVISELRAMQQRLRDVQARVARLDEAPRRRHDPLSDMDDRLALLSERLPSLASEANLAALGERLSMIEEDLRQWMQRTPTPVPDSPRIGSLASSSCESAIADPSAHEPASTEHRGMRVHRLVGGDTLWEIAESYLGAGDLYPVLLALNPGLGIFFSPGREIRLPQSVDQARRLLAEVIVERNGQRSMRYASVEGDTWQAISRRLYGHSKAAARLQYVNGGGRPEPGTSVMVPLIP